MWPRLPTREGRGENVATAAHTGWPWEKRDYGCPFGRAVVKMCPRLARDGPEGVLSLLSLKQVDPKRRKETYRGLPLFEPDQLNVERSFLSHVERSFSTHANSPSNLQEMEAPYEFVTLQTLP